MTSPTVLAAPRAGQGSPLLEISIRLPLTGFTLAVDHTARGPSTAVFGPSGAGKTSLLEVVAGLRKAGGRLSFAGETWLDSERRIWLPPEHRRVGYVPQEGLLFPHRSVRGNLLAGAARARPAASASPGSNALSDTRLSRVAELLELEDLLDRGVGQLSGGERQRVALGRALCSAPRLLLLDEPLSSLDHPLRRRILPLLARVRDELGLPMLLVSHDPREVQALADETVALSRGRVVAHGPPREVLTDPAVFPAAEEDGYENVLPAVVEAGADDATAVRLGSRGDGPRLLVPPTDAAPGTSLLVGIPAREAILAVSEPNGLSARNVLPGRIQALRPLDRRGGLILVTVEMAPALPALAIEVTSSSVDSLSLTPGAKVFVILKTAGCVTYGGAATATAPHSRGIHRD